MVGIIDSQGVKSAEKDSTGRRTAQERVSASKGRMRRIMLAAMARKLVVSLWKHLADGVVSEGAVLKA